MNTHPLPMTQSSCEACKAAQVQSIVESDDPTSPFAVCSACAHRLRTFSLRPLEWYNLVCSHSPYEFLLHDDFFDDDGTACQPEEDVVDAELFPAPTLEAVVGNVE